jgi:hypothetical protein
MAESSFENSGPEPGATPKFEIPSQPSAPEAGQESLSERAIEKQQVSESTPSKQTPQFTVQIPVTDGAQDATAHTSQSDQKSQISKYSGGLIAHDTDLIEKEWVERAKTIVARTQDDPFKQKDEMSKMKADYIKKRYNKTIPVDDKSKP